MRFLNPHRELIVGMTKTLTFDIRNAAGANTITGTPTVEASGLIFTGTAISGTTLTTKVSGGEGGKNYIATITALLSSGETEVGAVELEWKDPGFDSRAGRR